MSLILNGQKVPTPGLQTISWMDDPAVPRATDGSPRLEMIRAVVMHTVHGKVGRLLPGSKPSTRAKVYAKYQANTSRDVSWDYTIDTDGTVIVSNDPLTRFCWQATSVNPFTIGIEMVQEDNGDLYAEQIAAAVRFLEVLVAELGDRGHYIQRQFPMKAGRPVVGVVQRIADANRARTVTGMYGHRNQTNNRGPGDPGDYIYTALAAAGWQGFDYDANEDLAYWRPIQRSVGVAEDGLPGRATGDALKAHGYAHGIYRRS